MWWVEPIYQIPKEASDTEDKRDSIRYVTSSMVLGQQYVTGGVMNEGTAAEAATVVRQRTVGRARAGHQK